VQKRGLNKRVKIVLILQSPDERRDGLLDFRRFASLGARIIFCFIQAVPDKDIDKSQ
jgi:hypothetical protein